MVCGPVILTASTFKKFMNCIISFRCFAVFGFVFFVHGALLAGPGERTGHAGQGGKTNIILILTDEQGYGDQSSHAHRLMETPHADQLRDRSVSFENFYVSPSCSPMRPCDSLNCTTENYAFPCATLHNIEKGEKKATYTEENAPYHWGVTPPGHWALFDVKKDSCFKKDLAEAEPECVAAMVSAYDKRWDADYLVVVERGGAREFVCNVLTSDKAKGATAEAKPAR
jgi:hypothetical protein